MQSEHNYCIPRLVPSDLVSSVASANCSKDTAASTAIHQAASLGSDTEIDVWTRITRELTARGLSERTAGLLLNSLRPSIASAVWWMSGENFYK